MWLNSMLFILGIIVGILISLLVCVLFVLFKQPLQHTVRVGEKNIAKHAVKKKGIVIDPMTPSEEFRQNVISENNRKGRDTHINELL